MRVLISGAGIAGPCLAFWLMKYGFEPVIVERAPRLRRGGYMIDFWGAGFDVAERMGLVTRLDDLGYSVEEVRIVDERGDRVGGFSARVFQRLTSGRYTSLPRGDLAAAIYDRVAGRVETRLDDTVTEVADAGDHVRVRFERAAPDRFDLVIGADGLHSRVRELVFGPEARFERYLGYKVAAFESIGYRPRDELTYVVFTQVGQQVGRFAMRGDRTLFLFVFADPNPHCPGDDTERKALLRSRFAGAGWECKSILERLDEAEDLYLDRVSQIRMEQWRSGRVGLVGDAAFCVSLLAGQGSALAMVAAYVLAGELKLSPDDPERALLRYQEKVQPFLRAKQEAAERFAPSFVPSSRLGLFVRNQATRLLSLPWVAELSMGRTLRDSIELPEY